jgi:hypothetical protein
MVGCKGSWSVSSAVNAGARLEIFTAMKVQVKEICVVMPCSDVGGYQRFGGPCCLHLQGEDGGSMTCIINSEKPKYAVEGSMKIFTQS